MKFDVHELQAKLDYYFTGKLSKENSESGQIKLIMIF